MGGDVRAVLASSEADAGERVAWALERARDDLSVAAADGSTDALDLVGADCLVVDADHPPAGLLREVARTPGVNDLPVAFVPDVDPASTVAGGADDATGEGDATYANAADRVARRATPSRATREVRRRNERLEEFASVVSHDLRSPLTVAKGRLDLAAADCDSEHLRRAASALDRMSELVDDVLRLARAGSVLGRCRPVSLAEVARDAWRTSADERGTLTVDDGLGTVEGDETRLRQLFENLFRNSVEYGSTDSRTGSGDAVEHGSTNSRTESNEVACDADPGVSVRVGPLPGGDGFYVADDGPGVPPEVRDRAFESGVTTASDGTGFGLAIVRHVAAAHGWDVSLTESDRGGARFEFTGVRRASAE